MRRLQRPFVWLGLVLTASCASGRGTVGDEVADSGVETASLAGEIEALWREGQTFDLFLDGVRARREAWHENYRDAVVDGALVERLGGLPGRYRLLAVSLDGCTDSMVNLPVLARLVERVPALEFRVVDANRGRALMERYPTPDGRAATPTLVLLDDRFDVVGCWIERPAALQGWYLENKGTLPTADIYSGLIDWYDEDRGRSALGEIVAMVEAAARGEYACR